MSEHIIEVSACDHGGKSTQAEMLTYWSLQNVHNYGGLGPYHDDFQVDRTQTEDWNWWFRDTSLTELGSAVVGAYNYRQALAEQSPYDIAVVERGAAMIKAQLAANFATRRERDVYDQLEEVSDFVSDSLVPEHTDTQKHEFILLSDDRWFQSIYGSLGHTRNTLERQRFSPAQNDFYNEYQQNLALVLDHLSQEDNTDIVEVDYAAVDVQNRIRAHDSIRHLSLPQLLAQEPIVIGLAGLSESGKGAVADTLAELYGFTRLKLGFFNEIARSSTGMDYGEPSSIARSIVHFLACNRQLQRVTLESLHGPQLSAELRLLLGHRWKAVMLDVPDQVRQQRALNDEPGVAVEEVLAAQRAKDDVKLSHDLLTFREEANLCVDNTQSIEATAEQIMIELCQ